MPTSHSFRDEKEGRETGGDEGDEEAEGKEIIFHSPPCPILLYLGLRPKRSYAAGFTTPLSTSAQYPMPHAPMLSLWIQFLSFEKFFDDNRNFLSQCP
ncbi:MAG: hypothetical protein V7L29_27875 [Nostoc sp.]